MDFVGQLSSAMGLEQNQAQALAGAVMANVQGQVADGDAEAADAMGQAVPEMGGWLASAQALMGEGQEAPAEQSGGGMLSGLMGAASSGIGNQILGAVAGKEAQNAALLAGVMGKLGLDESKAMMAAPIALNFLQSRLDQAWVDKILAVAPMLSGGGTPDAGGAMGALGSLLGR